MNKKVSFQKTHPELYHVETLRVLRLSLQDTYGEKCMKCGKEGKVVLEHIVSRAIGGTNNLYNLQLLCWPCNKQKGLKIIDYRPYIVYKTPESPKIVEDLKVVQLPVQKQIKVKPEKKQHQRRKKPQTKLRLAGKLTKQDLTYIM